MECAAGQLEALTLPKYDSNTQVGCQQIPKMQLAKANVVINLPHFGRERLQINSVRRSILTLCFTPKWK
jgi:hypothetical protein